MPKVRKTIKGKANMLIDEIFHPYFKENITFIILDGFLHGLVEQNPNESIRKFLRYNLPELQKHVRGKTKRGKGAN